MYIILVCVHRKTPLAIPAVLPWENSSTSMVVLATYRVLPQMTTCVKGLSSALMRVQKYKKNVNYSLYIIIYCICLQFILHSSSSIQRFFVSLHTEK